MHCNLKKDNMKAGLLKKISLALGELYKNEPCQIKKNEVLTGRFNMPTPSDSEFFGSEGFFMRWTTFGVPLLVMSSEYESMK